MSHWVLLFSLLYLILKVFLKLNSLYNSNFKIEILNWQILEEIPSASGMAKMKHDFFVIGDDSPFLFRLDRDFNLISKSLINSAEKMVGSTIPKIGKADFEAMEMVSDTELLILGSGSKSPMRDVCVKVILGEEITNEEYDISLFYESLKNLEIMKGYELDIEALAFKNNMLYLFNRGRNIIFSVSYMKFIDYCKTGKNIPEVQSQLLALPKLKNLEAGFSGATAVEGLPYFIFTAAVEDTPNAYDDGEILGSFLGIMRLEDGVFKNNFFIQEIPSPGFPLKVESVVVDKIISSTQNEVVLVTDNDGQPSQILRAKLTFKP